MAEYKDVELLKKQIADFKRAVNSVKPMNSDYLTGYISALSVVEGAIADQPTADVAPVRHGRWISLDDYFEDAQCSECGDALVIGDCSFNDFCECYKYCPNCGGKMDKQ